MCGVAVVYAGVSAGELCEISRFGVWGCACRKTASMLASPLWQTRNCVKCLCQDRVQPCRTAGRTQRSAFVTASAGMPQNPQPIRIELARWDPASFSGLQVYLLQLLVVCIAAPMHASIHHARCTCNSQGLSNWSSGSQA